MIFVFKVKRVIPLLIINALPFSKDLAP